MYRIFLAMTSLKEAIDKSADKIFYVEDGCLRYVDNLDGYNIVDKSIKNKQDIIETKHLLDVVKEDLLKILSRTLNKLLGLDLKIETWRLIMMPWIEYYPEAMYNKLINVEKALELGANYTWTLCDISKDVPYHWWEFWIWGLRNEKYNYQLYSNVCEFKNIKVKKRIKIDTPKIRNGSKYNLNNLCKKMKIFILNYLARFAETLVMNPDYFNFNTREKIYMVIKSKFKIGFYYVEPNEQIKIKLNKKYREVDLQKELITDVEIEKLLLKYAMKDIPTTYLENIKKEIKKASKYKCNKIISPEDYVFYKANLVMAQNRQRGGKLYSIQIGGDGDILLDKISEAGILDKISNVLYTSGWDNKNYSSEIRHITNPRYMRAKNAINKKKIKRTDILYVGTNLYSYRLIIGDTYSLFSREYMEYSIDLLEHLAKDTKYSVKARFYPLDNGWNLEKRLMKKTNKIRIDDYSKTFIDTAQESKIVIVDAISTSWAETLAMNIPLLIVIPKFLDIYSEHGTELFNKLKSIGLYYNSYEEVVDTLNKIDDIDAWWATKQDTLNLIRKKYCWCADNPKKEWIDEFIKISKE